MENSLFINGYLSYKTNYFESFSEFWHNYNIINNKYVNILCCNIRSVNSNFDELTLFLENDPNSDKIDVIILTETWHNLLNQIFFTIEGYNLYFSSRKRNQNDGIFVYVRNNYNIDFFEYDFVETNIVKIHLNNLGVPIILLCIYRSPSTDINVFNNTVNKVIKENKIKDYYTVLIGDMNINIVGDNELNNDYLNLLSEKGFASFINVYTRVPNGQQHACLDHIFVHNNEHFISQINAGILQTDITDHFTTCVSIPITSVSTNKRNLISIIDHDKIKKILLDENWTKVYNRNNANECFSEFHKIISNYINNSTTFKNISTKNVRLKEWMSAGLLRSTSHKQSLFLKCRKNPNNTKLAIHYKKYKNKYTQILRLAKKTFYEKKFKSVSDNPKLTWKLIYKITCSKINNKDDIKTVIYNEQQYDVNSDPKEVSNIFNKFFINMGKKLAESPNFSAINCV